MAENLGGRPVVLTDELHAQIIFNIPYVIIPTQVAALSRISHQNLSNWLKWGAEQFKDGEDTIYSRLFADFKRKQAEVVSGLLEKIQLSPKCYQAYAWILEKCFRSDFGADSDEMKELREQFRQIQLLLGKGEKV